MKRDTNHLLDRNATSQEQWNESDLTAYCGYRRRGRDETTYIASVPRAFFLQIWKDEDYCEACALLATAEGMGPESL